MVVNLSPTASDALCALAFSGEPMARDAFLRLARSPSSAKVHRLVEYADAHEKLGLEGEAAQNYAKDVVMADGVLDPDEAENLKLFEELLS